MISELKKSVSAILYERLTSPFYGTILITWLLWNWKIPYVTFFISEEKLDENKLKYISNQLLNIDFTVIYPLVSTAVLILVLPFVANGAYWVSLKFDAWKREKRNKLENKQLLSIEESIALREAIEQQEERLAKTVESKDKEISYLKVLVKELNNLKGKDNVEPNKNPRKTEEEKYAEEYSRFSTKSLFVNYIQKIADGVQSGDGFWRVPSEAVSFFIGNNLIEKKGRLYEFTEKGKFFLKEYYNSKF